ncbi:uncharacterized protein METZ01_LOCUS400796 [marine metagenome]|uniref:Dephospho-CoA kinase n=1 Tax=marine metagenome TaxID=408172 RepID=A0A382VN38_9ZZZZ
MYKLGITGGMGSGKSTAADYFLQKGAIIFNADEEAKQYLLSQTELQNHIIDIFGNQVTSGNRLNLLKLSKHVFSNKHHQITLNQIIWPEVKNLIISAAEKAEIDGNDLFAVDAALLIEAGYTDFFHAILLITAEKSIRINRIKLRKDIPDSQIKQRMELQMPESDKQKHADTIIKNNGSLYELHMQLKQFWEKININ